MVMHRKAQVSNYYYLGEIKFGDPSIPNQIERIFSIVGILIALCRCWLKIKNLDKLISFNKNWPHEPCVECINFFDIAFICET
jgi:hypothetical protein